jgi:putative phage-type endonuclease
MSIARTTHNVQQGTRAWLDLREGYFTASEAPAALGVSRYVSRAELLRRKHTGIAEEHSPATLGKFAAGHDAEAKARPLAEAIADGELFPVTMSADVGGLRLLASLDGLTMDDVIAWETKLWNEGLAANVRAGTLPEHYTVQMDQELLVSGATRCLFTCTDGTPERFVSCWYESSPEKFHALIAGWNQFAADLAAYSLPPATEPAPVGKAPDSLPALRIEVTGMVTASNLAEFKATAMSAIQSVNRALKTDQDFADARKSIKWCEDIESRLKAAKEHALSQTADIDALFKAVDDISAEARRVRLDLEKVVTKRGVEVKEEAVTAARAALDLHIAAVNAEVAPMHILPVAADFAGAIKGKRSIDSMQDALDTTLAGAKIAADAQGRAIRANVSVFKAATGDDGTLLALFADLGQLVHKPADDFALLVGSRIKAHKEAEAAREAARQADEAQRIAQAEQRAREQEAARIAEQQRQQDEAERQAADALAAAAAPAPVPVSEPDRPAAQSMPTHAAPQLVRMPAPALPSPTAEPAALTLGAICGRLGFTVGGAFLADQLHVRPAATDKRAQLYTETQYQLICRQLLSHVGAMAELYAGVEA